MKINFKLTLQVKIFLNGLNEKNLHKHSSKVLCNAFTKYIHLTDTKYQFNYIGY